MTSDQAVAIRHRLFPCQVSSSRLPARAPTVILCSPLSFENAAQGLAQNLSEEGYEVILFHITSGHKSSQAENTDAVASVIVQTTCSQAGNGQGWNRYTVLVTIDLPAELSGLPSALHHAAGPQTGISAYVAYGCQDHRTANLLSSLPFPSTIHIAENAKDVMKAFVDEVEAGRLDSRALPFTPGLSKFDGALGPEEPLAVSVFTYANVSPTDSAKWACAFPFSSHTRDYAFSSGVEDADRSAGATSYSRTLSLLKKTVGPRFPLEQLWDQHTYFEFADRDSARTMATMVSQPYVNHVACLTGGAGAEELARFYEHHFTKVSPPDTKLIPISRTIGTDRIIDEMVFSCTHTTKLDYFLPGIEPTGKPLQIPMVGIVNLRGDKLAFESLYWDQSNALVQLGLLDPNTSATIPKTTLPITGHLVAQKILNPYGVPSNTLMPNWSDSADLPLPPPHEES